MNSKVVPAGMSPDEWQARVALAVAYRLIAHHDACVPLERVLSAQPYVCGVALAYGDYIVFSLFQMARLGSRNEVVATGSSIGDWRTRMIALFDDLGDRFPGYPK